MRNNEDLYELDIRDVVKELKNEIKMSKIYLEMIKKDIKQLEKENTNENK